MVKGVSSGHFKLEGLVQELASKLSVECNINSFLWQGNIPRMSWLHGLPG